MKHQPNSLVACELGYWSFSRRRESGLFLCQSRPAEQTVSPAFLLGGVLWEIEIKDLARW